MASPRLVKRAMTNPVLSGSKITSTVKFKSWYCSDCDCINDVDNTCENCSSDCGEYAGYCSRCDLAVPVCTVENKVECPFCFLDLVPKKM